MVERMRGVAGCERAAWRTRLLPAGRLRHELVRSDHGVVGADEVDERLALEQAELREGVPELVRGQREHDFVVERDREGLAVDAALDDAAVVLEGAREVAGLLEHVSVRRRERLDDSSEAPAVGLACVHPRLGAAGGIRRLRRGHLQLEARVGDDLRRVRDAERRDQRSRELAARDHGELAVEVHGQEPDQSGVLGAHRVDELDALGANGPRLVGAFLDGQRVPAADADGNRALGDHEFATTGLALIRKHGVVDLQ